MAVKKVRKGGREREERIDNQKKGRGERNEGKGKGKGTKKS